jgi:sigma-B regulation protein RsbU (phosphoserine phosphatase)
MDGYEVCERLKADTITRDIPILFISALDETQDKVRAFSLGAVDYVTKPFHLEEVLARVETHLALRRLQRQLEEANHKMERELTLAGEVQASFMPRRLPQVAGWQLAVALEPALETSGDFYDIHLLPNGRLGILVADVVEKGVGAALFMALSWILLRTYTVRFPDQPELVFSAVNRRILEDTNVKQFVTVYFGVVDPATGTLTYCNAGHCPPYLVCARKGREPERLMRTGIPLGLFANATWKRGQTHLDPGDVLVLYTDGITEAQDEQRDFYGEERLLDVVNAYLGSLDSRGVSAHDLNGCILADVHRFVGAAPQFDDIALAIVAREPG